MEHLFVELQKKLDLFIALIFRAGLVWSKCKQHSLWDMWIYHCSFRNNLTACDKRTRTI